MSDVLCLLKCKILRDKLNGFIFKGQLKELPPLSTKYESGASNQLSQYSEPKYKETDQFCAKVA